MKEECKLCSGWEEQQSTDFSISSLMRPSQAHEARQDAVLLSAYLLKLGYYQPAGPLIKETGADAERALARYHPAPHYHPPHPPMPPVQYGPPYYPADLCYGRYYRPSGPYHMPQPDAQMVGVPGEPYPPPAYYGTPPCYQHSPQRYVEYRPCPCPLNSCPKNVHIGPATGRAPTGGGPDVPAALAQAGGAFRAKVRACAIDADAHGSGKDPPLEPEPPAAADAPHPCPLPAIGGASPKREMFDVRDLRLSDLPGPAEGPPSPARGSAGACAPQPPPIAPRRARLGKEMARRSLVGDDTALLLCPNPPPSLSDGDDDVMAISPPASAPIDLSSSDERATPLVDVKKENEGPTNASSRKTDAQALREHNSTTTLTEQTETTPATKAVKRRYSRPKLEIDMKDTQLEDVCKTNGIGEHVKLQKRRKISCEQASITRAESIPKEAKKKTLSQTPKRTPKTPTSEKKAAKRKSESNTNCLKAKKTLIESPVEGDPRLLNVAALPEDLTSAKPKNKSALLLDNLIRKNSIDRPDAKGNKEINPAELFLNPSENTSPKKTNINNNIVEKSPPVSGVRPNTIAAVTQLIEKKLANKKACKVEKVDSKVTNSLKSVLKAAKTSDDSTLHTKCKASKDKFSTSIHVDKKDIKSIDNFKTEVIKDDGNCVVNDEKMSIKDFVPKLTKTKSNKNESAGKVSEESHILNLYTQITAPESKDSSAEITTADKKKRHKLGTTNANGHMKTKSIERVAKLLSKKPAARVGENETDPITTNTSEEIVDKVADREKTKKPQAKRYKVNGEAKGQSIEKVAKLLVSKKPKTDDSTEQSEDAPEIAKPKRCKLTDGEMKKEKVKLLVPKKPAIKVDEATLVVEDACASPAPGRRRRRSAGRGRRAGAPDPPPPGPRAPPRWSNGWAWDGEPYTARVYLNNDSRFDRWARCWHKMRHGGGDAVSRGDCVLLRASAARAPPFVARVASLWENPDDGEMMVSLVWYYRPEHTERGRGPADAADEVFASRHRDANSVACIEDKCHVLTFNEYCRYRKRLKAAEEGVTIAPSIVPPLPPGEVPPLAAPNDSKLPPSVSPELVLFCRKIYDFRSKKIQVPNK